MKNSSVDIPKTVPLRLVYAAIFIPVAQPESVNLGALRLAAMRVFFGSVDVPSVTELDIGVPAPPAPAAPESKPNTQRLTMHKPTKGTIQL